MRKFLKNLILMTIMTLTSINASADKYERAWKLVDKDIEQDLPESAAAKVNGIFDMAASEHDSKQMLKSAVYISRIEAMTVRDNLTSSIELFNSLLPKLGQSEYKAICHAFLAKSYIQYWNRNKSRVVCNLPEDGSGSGIPLEKLTAGQLCDTIMEHLQLSIDKAGNAPGKWFEDFFPGGNKEGMKLRPTLTDLLLDNAITPISGQHLNKGQRKLLQDRRLYGTGSDFVAATMELEPNDPDLWELHVLNLLTARHLESKPEIRSTIDSRRMDVLAGMLDDIGSLNNRWSETDSVWVDGMIYLAEGYGKKVSFASIFLSKAAARIQSLSDRMTDEQEIRYTTLVGKLCRKAMEVWPKSEGAFDCAGLLGLIEAKEVNLTLPGDLMAGGSNLALFEYRNVGTVFFRAVEVAGEIRDAAIPSVLDQLACGNVASEWKVVMGSPNDNVSHYGLTGIPPLMQGSYYILASTGSNFGAKDVISLAYTECRALAFVPMETEKGNIEGYFVNTRTGRPEPDVKYTLWQLDYEGNGTKIAKYGFGDSDGHILIEGLNGGSYNFELSRGIDMGSSRVRVNYVHDMPQNGTVRLYTDRYTYRPGDSVQFAVVYYSGHGLSGGKVIAAAPVTVSLRNASSKEIAADTLVTDSMGMAVGKFRIPAEAMPGRFSLRVTAGEQGETVSAWNSINVENFNQSKFTVGFDAFDQLRYLDREVCLTGSAVTMTGQPLSGARVQWSADLDDREVNVFIARNAGGRYVRLAGGQDFTTADGRFSLKFTVPEDMMTAFGGSAPVMVSVRVTDLNGETRTADANVIVGSGSREISTGCSRTGILPDEGIGIKVGLVDNGRNVKGSVKVLASPLENISGPGISLETGFDSNILWLNGRERGELTASAEKQELAGSFPRYCLNFSAGRMPGKPLMDRTVAVDEKESTVKLKLDRSGEYRMRFESELAVDYELDGCYLLESDREWVPDDRLLFALAESDTVNVGDTAVIRLGNRWKESVILYSILDRMGMNSYGTLVSTGSQMKLEIPVTRALEGGFTIHLFCMLDNLSAYENIHIDVPYASHTLIADVSHGSDVAAPGDGMVWNFRVKNSDGSPAASGLLLDMYDRALDAYGTNRWQLQPWSGVYPYVYPSFSSRYSQQYDPSWYSDGKPKTYTGKVALTGVLLDPLAGYMQAMETSVMHLRGAAMAKNSDAAMEEESLPGTADSEQLPVTDIGALRTDMNPTGLFAFVRTDSLGSATVSFPAPQLLTRWRVQAIMWSDSLSVGRVEFEKVTAKDIMIEPAAPRFVRQGDSMDFSFKIMNGTDRDMDVRAGMELKDAVSGQPVKVLAGGKSASAVTVHVPACGSGMAVFRLAVPKDGLQAMEYTLSAACGKYQDALRQTVPVLSTRTLVTRSVSLFNNGNETRSFSFDELRQPLSAQAADERLVLEYSSTPMWYAIQCLPTLIKTDDPSSLRLAHSILGSASARDILRRNPDVTSMVAGWAAQPAGEWQSRLERNGDLTASLVENTPWYLQSQNEKDRLRNLGKALDEELVAGQLDAAVSKLTAMHIDGAGWPWMDGMPSDVHITISILECLGRLQENGALTLDSRLRSAVSSALAWLDAHFAKECEAVEKPQSVGALEMSYLLAVRRFDSFRYTGRRDDVHRFYMNLAAAQDTRNLSLMERAQLALVLVKTDAGQAEHVVQTMLERSVLEDEMGRYWKDNKSGYRWQDAPVEAQSLAIEALLATGHAAEASECSRWLLKQRQTSDWGTSPATAHAVVALLAAGEGPVQMAPDITVSLGQRSFKAADNSSYGYMKVELPGRAPASAADIKVQSQSDGISWGAVYYQYSDNLENVTASSNGIVLERSLWRVASNADGDFLQDIWSGAALGVGDRVRVRLELSVPRAMEYVRLRDMWAAGLEPEDTGAGWRGGRFFSRGYYMVPGNSGMDFYFDRLEQGKVMLEYDMYVQKSGAFQAGTAEVQCMYSPDMRSGTASQTVIVNK